jgi:phosphoribosylformylglycinamidine synthase
MRYRARIEVSLKPGYSDPEGNATKKSLVELQYDVESVKVSKVYRIVLNSDSYESARKTLDEMCKRLLANPTRDEYDIQIEGSL